MKYTVIRNQRHKEINYTVLPVQLLQSWSILKTYAPIYYFYNIINGNMYIIRPSSGFTTALTNDVKNGDPYIIIFSCPNSVGSSHKAILLR